MVPSSLPYSQGLHLTWPQATQEALVRGSWSLGPGGTLSCKATSLSHFDGCCPSFILGLWTSWVFRGVLVSWLSEQKLPCLGHLPPLWSPALEPRRLALLTTLPKVTDQE